MMRIIILLTLGCLVLSDTLNDCNKRIILESLLPSLENFTIKTPSPTNDTNTCWYQIEARKNEGIRLLFKKLDVDECSGDNCCNYIEIGEGSVIGEHRLMALCNANSIGEPLFFQSNEIWLSFKLNSNGNSSPQGYHGLVSTFKTVYNELQGSIICPNVDESTKYSNNVNLTYKIELPIEYVALVSLKNTFFEEFNDTCYDYLQIGENLSSFYFTETHISKSNLTICGIQTSQEYLSKSNVIYIHFNSDSSETNECFEINYQAVKTKFSNPEDIILSPSTSLNLTYTIQAPLNHKIDLTIDEFDFNDCQVNNLTLFAERPSEICAENDYLRFMNKISQNVSNEWTFCSCYKPPQLLISYTNEISFELSAKSKSLNRFKIYYQFSSITQKKSKQIRINQDKDLSYIGGYILRVKVPSNNHLRLFGKSIKCNLPQNSTISFGNETRELSPIDDQCAYLFDLNEPHLNSNNEWYVSWLIKIDSPLDQIDFEVNWSFIKNKFVDAEDGILSLPAQTGFKYSEEVEFFFHTSTSRQYNVKFDAKPLNASEQLANILGRTSYVKLKKSNKDSEDLIHIRYLNETNILKLEAEEVSIKVKRDDSWGLDISFELDKFNGDCSFDKSLCGYSRDTNKENYLIQHKPKHGWDNGENIDDYYLAITRPLNSVVNRAIIYSPLIAKHNSSIELFNKKVHMVSFSFKMTHPLDNLELIVLTSRPEMSEIKNNEKMVLIETFGQNDGIDILDLPNGCKSNEFGRWKRVTGIKIFSCYDFKIGFGAIFSDESNVISIDDVKVEQLDEVQKCSNDDCGEHGSCFTYSNKAQCCCNQGFEGEKCQNKISICQNEDSHARLCKNNGTCIESLDSYDYSCVCPDGFTGKQCEVEIDECEQDPCQNGGRCLNKIGSYACICKRGFSGRNCELKDSVDCGKCKNSACFVINANEVYCKCNPGWTGESCDIDIDECESNPCVHQDAQCLNLENSFKCECPKGFAGNLCETKIDYCKNLIKNPCKNGGLCVSASDNYTCACQLGYTGEYCENLVDHCSSDLCNGGECINQYLTYKCNCPRGRTGAHCEVKLKNPCESNKCAYGSCVPRVDGYDCLCNEFYEGIYCDQLKTCNKTEFLNFCDQNGTQEVVSYGTKCMCKCHSGYFGDKCEFSEDICKLKNFECQNGGTCIASGGQTTCYCKKGFSGELCEVIENYCSNNPCSSNGRCKNIDGGHICECYQGFKGDDCSQRVYECNINKDCVQENTLNVYNYNYDKCLCECKLGFTGAQCETSINDCKLSNATCKHGRCIDYESSYKCICDSGFTGMNCDVELKDCERNPCKNGTCETLVPSGYKCTCNRGFTGQNCEIKIDNCASMPCDNGGTCHDLIDNFYCECPIEYGQSRTCSERKTNPCLAKPCGINGTCTPVSRTSIDGSLIYIDYTCQCSPAFTGKNCETYVTPCLSNPCQNFGKCGLKSDGDYFCRCFAAFTGKNCESYFDTCESNPCLNGGSCYQTPDGFRCQCPHGLTGPQCQTKANLCDTITCLNGGKCEVTNSIPICKCSSDRFIGSRCQIDLDSKKNKTSPELQEFLSTQPDCDYLGSDSSLFAYALASLTLFFILLVIILIIYIYVHCRIRHFKKSAQTPSENATLSEYTITSKD